MENCSDAASAEESILNKIRQAEVEDKEKYDYLDWEYEEVELAEGEEEIVDGWNESFERWQDDLGYNVWCFVGWDGKRIVYAKDYKSEYVIKHYNKSKNKAKKIAKNILKSWNKRYDGRTPTKKMKKKWKKQYKKKYGKKWKKKYKKKCKKYVRKYAKRKMPDRDKAWAAYYWIAKNCSYDWENKAKERHYSWAVFEKKKAVCDGYSRAYKMVCEELGIPCKVIVGKYAYTENESERHAWNKVRLDGKWYWCDLTNDDIDGADVCGDVFFCMGSIWKEWRYKVEIG